MSATVTKLRPDICPTCGQRKKRSIPQNARLHKLFTEISSNLTAKDGLYHSHQWWKVMMKDHFLGYEPEYRRPDGKVIEVLRSTADLSVDELNEFMTQVEMYANERGVYLED